MKFKITILFSICLVLILLYFQVPVWIFFILLILFCLVLFIGVKNIRWNYFLTAQHSINKKQSIVLTFDDGPHPEYTPQVLDILKKQEIKAVFFCIGKNAEKYPELIKRIQEEGHILGNHTFTHSHYIDFKLSNQWIEEIQKTEEVIFNISNKKTLLFRPPYGITTPHLAEAVKKTKYKTIGWTVRSYDTVDRDLERTIQNIKNKTREGNIILLHDTHSRISVILEEIIPYFKEKKYQFTTINEF